jgi:hypothetical protein
VVAIIKFLFISGLCAICEGEILCVKVHILVLILLSCLRVF